MAQHDKFKDRQCILLMKKNPRSFTSYLADYMILAKISTWFSPNSTFVNDSLVTYNITILQVKLNTNSGEFFFAPCYRKGR